MTSSNTTAPAASTTADTAIQASLTVPCEAGQVHAVREFVGQALGDDPCPEIPVLLASELATNSVLHGSTCLGGNMTVTVSGDPDGTIRVEVADAGGSSVPALQGGRDGWAESRRGLHLVDDLFAQWGYRIEPDGGLVTWFEVRPAARTPTDQHRHGRRS
jgi:anti-sigma regulatory factor (Ser/Thr protein kinase)